MIPSGLALRADAVDFFPILKLENEGRLLLGDPRPENLDIPEGMCKSMMLEVYGENGATALADTIVPGEMTISKLNWWQRTQTDNPHQRMQTDNPICWHGRAQLQQRVEQVISTNHLRKTIYAEERRSTQRVHKMNRGGG